MENPIQCVTLYQNDLKTNVSYSLFYWVKREIMLLLFSSVTLHFFEKIANHVMTIILAGLFFLYSAALLLLKRWDSWEGRGKEGWWGRGTEVGGCWKQRTARWIPATKWRDGSLKCWINLQLSLSLSQRGLQGEGRLHVPLPGSHHFLHMPWLGATWHWSALYGLLSTQLGSRHAEPVS